MIRLFVSDIDGCLTEPYAPFDLETISQLRGLTVTGSVRNVPQTPPGFTLCTGRPLGYAEAVAQALDVRMPFLFEAGAGMFDPSTGQFTPHPDFGPDDAVAVRAVSERMAELARGTSLSVEHGKFAQAGLIGSSTEDIERLIDPVTRFVESTFPGFTVAHTPISIDVMSKRITKAEGMRWLVDKVGAGLDETAFIGDTNGDLGALKIVGMSFSPLNGTEEVKNSVTRITRKRHAKAVLEAYRTCIESNRA